MRRDTPLVAHSGARACLGTTAIGCGSRRAGTFATSLPAREFLFQGDPAFSYKAEPQRFRKRTRWANEVVKEMVNIYRLSISERLMTGRSLLRIVNSIECEAQDG